ncbi:magnesium transporter CorA [Staphylococcus sp. HMSC068D08]|jgi:magnesium transporter|uniref:Magnesium transport protein CorA n=1 Tax=Staphylococcus lugdunensis TaxID=28035 RepID=A0ABD4EIB4_STALU|nr:MULTISPECIES: magnesium/cobalt transporter CorA [Staphylococcus]EFU84064.1 magnesium and cobalt transport protein CorA [Staphylococcus lugdunensis M23590]KAK55942.1 magnesium and cobalt transport protein CorA [Staphylococcus lugdunensis VCU150]KXA39999.1 magnesium and cobalt transport protein CorA [Staphylococcus lugdunensis]MCC2083438.1 magnesium/cobalt transporter CorA [Staphylococcus lugdunensis]MCH8679063.1 magnesium/cobalt transporter CorA [Staphylococcus lugdunensis]
MSITIRYQTPHTSLTTVPDIADVPRDATIVWYDFEDATAKENDFLRENFDFNYLEIDDTITGVPRVKYKAYDDYQYIVFHSINSDDYSPRALNVFLKNNVLVTYHHKHFSSLMKVAKWNAYHHDGELDCADIVIHILDMMVDKYFDFVYDIEEKVYNFEDKHVDDALSKKVMDNVFKLRSDLIKIKRVMFPMQELVETIKSEGNLIVDSKHSMYIQHIDDHLIKQSNIIRTSQEMTNEIRENYESYSSFRMNSIMQILTLVSVIFSPLTFIAGVYGMNFDNMPELRWHYSYYICLVVMLVIAIALIIFFRKKRWF